MKYSLFQLQYNRIASCGRGSRRGRGRGCGCGRGVRKEWKGPIDDKATHAENQ